MPRVYPRGSPVGIYLGNQVRKPAVHAQKHAQGKSPPARGIGYTICLGSGGRHMMLDAYPGAVGVLPQP